MSTCIPRLSVFRPWKGSSEVALVPSNSTFASPELYADNQRHPLCIELYVSLTSNSTFWLSNVDFDEFHVDAAFEVAANVESDGGSLRN
eukprot:4720044-Pleurochrysis_carterae.AAC.1